MAQSSVSRVKAYLEQVDVVLEAGGKVQFIHQTCTARLFTPTGISVSLDGRTYHGFLDTRAKKLHRFEYGSLETKDLMIEWRTCAHNDLPCIPDKRECECDECKDCPKLKHGTVCSKCGRTVTQAEYNSGESTCCHEGVVAEEDYK